MNFGKIKISDTQLPKICLKLINFSLKNTILKVKTVQKIFKRARACARASKTSLKQQKGKADYIYSPEFFI